ncbi:MBL fold metallo-hydrolase [Balneola sp. MJW-20]|uniref:MBL fold metallo-hydrolase n=1 Tax=Gracilimonas aurantiaca TaxID=3234185 RepID=UPI0034677F93
MNRREFLIRSSMITTGALMPRKIVKLFQESPFRPVRGDVGYFLGRGGTIGWLSNTDALVAVDSQYPQSAQAFISGMKERNTRTMDYLINTHHHGDHTGGNKEFLGYADHILAHENVPGLQKAAAENRGPETVANQAYADETYTGKWSNDMGSEKVHCMNYGPGHTGGDTVVYFEKANVAHMGDLVFNRVYPFIDRNGKADIANWIKVLRTTADELESDTIYLFGHGNPEFGVQGSKEDLIRKSDYLEALFAYTQKSVNEGRSLEEMSEIRQLKSFEEFNLEGWSLSLASNIQAAYLEITEGTVK